jgi:hypothetical protein
VFFSDRVLGHMISLDGAVNRAPHQTGTGQQPWG